MKTSFKQTAAAAGCLAALLSTAAAFDGRIHAVVTYGTETAALIYTAETNSLRVEMTAANRPNPVNLVDRKSGALTLVFPHNRSFVRLPAANAGRRAEPLPDSPASAGRSLVKETMGLAAPARPPAPLGGAPSVPGGLPGLPLPAQGLPPGVGPQVRSVGTLSAATSAKTMAPMITPARERLELKATGEKTNILGLACSRYELKQLGETLEVWATDQLLPFQPYVRNQMPGQGPRGIQELWPELLASRKLFPLQASFRNPTGKEVFNFAVTSVQPAKLADADAKLFAPPAGYFEIQPLPL